MSEMKSHILVIDDEKQIRKYLSITLSTAGYRVSEAEKGQEGARLTASIKPDLVICDLGLPDMDGNEVITAIREWSGVPILVLSVRSDSQDVVSALDNGADDYLIKPFDSAVLLARIRANLRKSFKQELGEAVLRVGPIVMDVAKHEVTRDGELINLSPKEYKLLRYFMANAGKMIMHTQLLAELWGKAHEENIQYLRIYVGQLRQKIEPDPAKPSLIITQPGIGYRMENGE